MEANNFNAIKKYGEFIQDIQGHRGQEHGVSEGSGKLKLIKGGLQFVRGSNFFRKLAETRDRSKDARTTIILNTVAHSGESFSRALNENRNNINFLRETIATMNSVEIAVSTFMGNKFDISKIQAFRQVKDAYETAFLELVPPPPDGPPPPLDMPPPPPDVSRNVLPYDLPPPNRPPPPPTPKGPPPPYEYPPPPYQ